MNKLYLVATLTSFLLLSDSVSAQWTDVVNNNINFEIRIKENYYGGDNDFDGNADPAITTYIEIDNTGLVYNECTDWDCSAPCSYTNFHSSDRLTGEDMPFDSEFYAEIEAHESDASHSECIYQTGDDHEYSEWANFRSGQQTMLVVYPHIDFYPANWNRWLAGGNTAWLYPNSSVWDQQLESTWRYTHGDEFGDPLSFGTLINQQIRSDVNSNRDVDHSYQTDLHYYNHDDSTNASPDVFYSFTLTSVATVTISTDHAETGFDTYLKLFDENATLLAEDDDSGSGERAVITKDICEAGTYIFMVEGYGPLTGVFKVSVEAEYSTAQVTISPNITHVSCPGAMDGLVVWGVSGGLPPYNRMWESNASGGVEEDLAIGSYVASVEDACGTFSAAFIEVENGDDTNPVANCISYTDITVSGSGQTSIAPSSLDNGSTDNCGITQTILTPSIFTAANAGPNNAIFTVYDANGNTDTCAVTVNVQVITGIEEPISQRDILVFPNPGSGLFKFDFSSVEISEGAMLVILDNLGRVVFSNPITSTIHDFDLSNLSPGIYHCALQNTQAIINTEMVVIR